MTKGPPVFGKPAPGVDLCYDCDHAWDAHRPRIGCVASEAMGGCVCRDGRPMEDWEYRDWQRFKDGDDW